MPPLNYAKLAADIRAAHERCLSAARSGLRHAVEAGRLLLTVRSRTPHGGWERYVTNQCGLTPRLAQRYMQAARHIGQLTDAEATRVADLSFRQLLFLARKNARAARKIDELDRAEVLETTAERLDQAADGPLLDEAADWPLPDAQAEWRRMQEARRQAQQRETTAEIEASRGDRGGRAAWEQAHPEEERWAPRPPTEPPRTVSGFVRIHPPDPAVMRYSAAELAELLEELEKRAEWFRRLEAQLRAGYYEPIPGSARQIEEGIRRLHRHLSRVRPRD
jgi:hypothetical protein